MYISVSELGIPEELLIRLTDDEGSGSINEARAETAISSAEALVDSALSRVYVTPLDPVPGLVRDLTRDIAVYNRYMRAGSMPAEVQSGYKAASDIIEKVARREFCIGIECPGPEFNYQDREFSREYMEGF